MKKLLLEILILMNLLLVISTAVNVVQKLNLISGPSAHIIIAIINEITIFGYIGVLNALFLKKKFYKGRIIYITIAGICQFCILCLSVLAYQNVLQYSLVIVIIYAISGFIVMVNFTCAVLVITEQQRQIDNDEIRSENAILKRKIAALIILARSKPYVQIQLVQLDMAKQRFLPQKNEQEFHDETFKNI